MTETEREQVSYMFAIGSGRLKMLSVVVSFVIVILLRTYNPNKGF
jgi:hypothetical protein